MRRIAATTALCFMLSLGNSASAQDVITGVRYISVETTDRAEPLSVAIWYPAQEGGKPVRVGANGVFQGVEAHEDAPIAEGAFPIVLVSHGGLRSAPNLASWLNQALAKQGFVVADAHAAPLGADQAALAPAEIWKRPTDLTTVLSALETEPALENRLDAMRVGVVGFYLGGTAAISLAGAEMDPESFAEICDARRGDRGDCGWLTEAGVDLHAIPPEQIARSHFDPRVKAAIAIDPELSEAFSELSLGQLATPIEVITLGAGDVAAFAKAPSVSVQSAPQATRYSAFGLCKPNGAAILADAGADPAICQSDDEIGREHVQADLAQRIGNALRAWLR